VIKVSMLDSDFAGSKVVQTLLGHDALNTSKNSYQIHTLSKKDKYSHCVSHLSLCGKKIEKFQK